HAGDARGRAGVRQRRHRRRERALSTPARGERARPRRRDRRGLRCRAARQRRVAEVRRHPHGRLRRSAAVSDRIRRTRRHEPRRAAAAVRRRWRGADVRAGRRRGAPRKTTAEARTACAEMNRLVIPRDQDNVILPVDGKEVRLTNLRKIFWPELKLTKGDLLQYYADVADALLPHIVNRAMVMKRYPHGASGAFFFMKRAPSPRPSWIEI